jgi:hypothetical protein
MLSPIERPIHTQLGGVAGSTVPTEFPLVPRTALSPSGVRSLAGKPAEGNELCRPVKVGSASYSVRVSECTTRKRSCFQLSFITFPCITVSMENEEMLAPC